MNARSLLPATMALLIGGALGYLVAPGSGGAEPIVLAGHRTGSQPVHQDPVTPLAGGSGGGRRSEVEAPSQNVPALSPHRVKAAISSIAEPEAQASAAGSGEIVGRVMDAQGLGLEGATIIVRRMRNEMRLEDPNSVGAAAAPETTLEEHLQEAAEDWSESRADRLRCISGKNGVYRAVGLDPMTNYRLSAQLEGHIVHAIDDAYRIRPGSEVDFRARAVATLEVLVVDAAGSPVDEAAVFVQRSHNSSAYAWAPDDNQLRLSPGRTQLRAYQGWSTRHAVGSYNLDSDHASEKQTVMIEPGSNGPVTLELAPRTGIRGTWDGEQEDDHLVKLLELGGGTEFSEEALGKSSVHSDEDNGFFHFMDLAPGRYAVGATDWEGKVIFAYEIVDVTSGLVEVALKMGERKEVPSMTVAVTSPAGRLLPDIHITVERKGENNSSHFGVNLKENDDGTYAVPLKGEIAKIVEPWAPQETYSMRVTHPDYGQKNVPLTQGQMRVDVQFDEPISIRVQVDGYANCAVKGRLRVTAKFLADGNSGREYWTGGQGDPKVDSSGVAVLEGLVPGRYQVTLNLGTEMWNERRVASQEVDARRKNTPCNFAAPVVHDVTVIAPTLSKGTYMYMRPVTDENDGMQGRFRGRGSLNAELDENLRATFRDVVPGAYTLGGNNASDTMEVTVPCGEIVFSPRVMDALEVRISDIEGILYVAGLRPGDRILEVVGIESTANAMRNALGGNRPNIFTVVTLREGENLTFTIPSSEDTEGQSLGGSFHPTHRDD